MRFMTRSALPSLAALALVAALPTALAHGHDEATDMDTGASMNMGTSAELSNTTTAANILPSYFSHPEHAGVLYAHIVLSAVAWIVLLPMGVLFSIARSRYTLSTQFVFLMLNTISVVLGISYNASTPDLYPNNSHHKIGWIATWVVCAQGLISLVGKAAGVMRRDAPRMHSKEEQQAFIPVSTQNMAEHQRMNDEMYTEHYRHSNDSGQGTEPNTESLRNSSNSSSAHDLHIEEHDRRKEYEDEDLEFKLNEMLPPAKAQSMVARIAAKISNRTWKGLLFAYNFIDRTILILGFITLVTGIATWGRFFEGQRIFTGLAHWIKGGVFFWYGVLTLGRWSGSFGEIGWAWNVRPKRSQKWTPTAEFVEGFLIFFYGSTNIFLEHLGGAGGPWTPQDLEHISITVLFIGGGLLAMLIESTRMRELLNTAVTEQAIFRPDQASLSGDEREALQPPRTYEFSINPIPALVILLLGIMMSSHTQASMISSMVHKQWGNLLAGASFARGLTYVLFYLKPPRSVLPSRPPTELLTAFGLIAGGIMFMVSSGDTVDAMVRHDLDAMFCYTVTLGFVGLLMAWEVVLLALKGWAVRKEAGKPQTNTWFASSRV